MRGVSRTWAAPTPRGSTILCKVNEEARQHLVGVGETPSQPFNPKPISGQIQMNTVEWNEMLSAGSAISIANTGFGFLQPNERRLLVLPVVLELFDFLFLNDMKAFVNFL